jgi:multiple sugar transport system ATP-binding protein
MNFINGNIVEKGSDLYFEFGKASEEEPTPVCSLKLPAEKANNEALREYIGQEVVAGLRPESIFDDPMRISSLSESLVETDVDVTELMGAEIYLYLSVPQGDEYADPINLTARVSARSTSRAGDKIKVAFDMSRMHFFDKDTEKCICH